MRTDFADLLRPNTPDERAQLHGAIIRLSKSEDFGVLFRHWNAVTPMFNTVFANDSAEKAAARDGALAHLREVFHVLLTASAAEKPVRKRKQKTEPENQQ